MANWVMVVVMVNGPFSNLIVTIPGFNSRKNAGMLRSMMRFNRSPVRDAFCLIQRGRRPINGQHEPMQD
jgi:hypothetical protein